MGASCSNSAPADSIDEDLAKDMARAKLNLKILVLGAGESGKSTVVKQLRNIHRGKSAYSDDEVQAFKEVLHINTCQSMHALIRGIEKLGLEWGDDDAETKTDAELFLAHGENDPLNLDDAVLVEKLWRSDMIQKVYDRRTEIYFPSAGPYYFDHVFDFVEDSYKPSETDIVMARVRTTGMIMTDLDDPPLTYTVVDVGGQRSERKKWIRHFDNVDAIMFMSNLSGYNKVLFEDDKKNRMIESMELFESITTNAAFKDTPIFLFLNLKDLFEEMLRDQDITTVFPDYKGAKDNMQESLDYIAEQFQARMPADKKIAGFHFVAARMKKDVEGAFSETKKTLKELNAKTLKAATKKLGIAYSG